MAECTVVDFFQQLRDGPRAAGFVAVHRAGDQQARAGGQAVVGVGAQVCRVPRHGGCRRRRMD
jgi:hypothetical protein